MFGVDVKLKRKIADMSLINFWEIGTRIDTKYPPKIKIILLLKFGNLTDNIM